MKIACLLMCHKDIEQVNRLINVLSHPSVYIFIHADQKMGIIDGVSTSERVFVLPENMRVDVQWAQFSQVKATLNLIHFALTTGEYDFYCLISGQDFLIRPVEEWIDFLNENNRNDFINLFESKNYICDKENHYDKRCQIHFANWMIGRKRWQWIIKNAYIALTGGYNKTFKCFKRKDIPVNEFYFGSTWWILTGQTIDWMMDYLDEHPQYLRFFQDCLCSDESFFQTLVMNSPYAGNRKDYLHYIDWSEGKSSPKTLTIQDLPRMRSSGKFFARKVDRAVDQELITLLESSI